MKQDKHTCKRLFDIVISGTSLIVLSPVLLGTAIAVRWKLGSPILFQQQRPGFKGKPFYIYKFRTMTDERDENGVLLSDQARLNSFGSFLRATSIDELPELLNVLKGEMSLVGPRPLLIEYLPLYSIEQARRHDVKPGITGWAQINGRNAITWEEKFQLDVWYVENMSLMLDMKILAATVWKVLSRSGISQEGKATVDYFKGSKR